MQSVLRRDVSFKTEGVTPSVVTFSFSAASTHPGIVTFFHQRGLGVHPLLR